MSTQEHKTYAGTCMCGAVKIQVTGEPRTAGYCHCETCQKWHAAPVNAWAVWRRNAVEVIEGEEFLEGFEQGSNNRQRCRKCGSGLMNVKSKGYVIVYAVTLTASGYVHKPSCHIHYDESVLSMADGLPKYEDSPEEWGGSGRMFEEPSETIMRSPLPAGPS